MIKRFDWALQLLGAGIDAAETAGHIDIRADWAVILLTNKKL